MSDELERLKRLRSRQLSDRDPGVKAKKSQTVYTRQVRKKAGERYTLGEAWRTIPNVYRASFICLFVGLCLILFLPQVWHSPWAFWAQFLTLQNLN
jgi:hypothetical protein